MDASCLAVAEGERCNITAQSGTKSLIHAPELGQLVQCDGNGKKEWGRNYFRRGAISCRLAWSGLARLDWVRDPGEEADRLRVHGTRSLGTK